MKFYKDIIKFDYWNKIRINKLTAILNSKNTLNYTKCVYFFKNGKAHNAKNAAYTDENGFEDFYLNDKHYGNQKKFTKKSWHRFVKLKAFL